MRLFAIVLFAASAVFGCSHPVDIQPEPASNSGAGGGSSTSSHGAQGNVASTGTGAATTSASAGSGGGAPAGVLRVNTPEMDPGQYLVVDALFVNQTDMPSKVADGPFMVTEFQPQQGGRLFVAPGPTCPSNVSGQVAVPVGTALHKPVLPGWVLCAAYGTYSDPPNGISVVSFTGYFPYAL